MQQNSKPSQSEFLPFHLQTFMSLTSKRIFFLPHCAFDPNTYHLLLAFIHHLSHLLNIFKFFSTASSLQSINVFRSSPSKKNFWLDSIFLSSYCTLTPFFFYCKSFVSKHYSVLFPHHFSLLHPIGPGPTLLLKIFWKVVDDFPSARPTAPS